jgi:hypothetical protein
MLATQCAVYDHAFETSVAAAFDVPDGPSGNATAGRGSLAGASFAADSDRFYGGGGSAPANAGMGDEAEGGSSGATSGGGTGAGQQPAGGVSGAAGGTSAGAGDSVVEVGGTDGVADYNLSQGRPTTTDSEQSHKFHFAQDGNDGDRSTRWCARDWYSNHYWEVDLGDSFNLNAVRILWEKNTAYLFKVESSVDRSAWSLVLDKRQSSSVAADRHHRLPLGTTGRYVRITVTGGLSSTVWASFYELEVFGH